ncbi:MAG: hypothetical protein M3376_02405, partial [Actinomycetota bacterium]|nr:hypothetical protein [Actinomycetota bacterium]
MLARIAAEIEAQRALLRTSAGRAVAGGLAALALLTVVGMAALWPGEDRSVQAGTIVISQGILAAEVTAVTAMN